MHYSTAPQVTKEVTFVSVPQKRQSALVPKLFKMFIHSVFTKHMDAQRTHPHFKFGQFFSSACLFGPLNVPMHTRLLSLHTALLQFSVLQKLLLSI